MKPCHTGEGWHRRSQDLPSEPPCTPPWSLQHSLCVPYSHYTVALVEHSKNKQTSVQFTETTFSKVYHQLATFVCW